MEKSRALRQIKLSLFHFGPDPELLNRHLTPICFNFPQRIGKYELYL